MSHSTISNDYSDLPHHFNSNLTLAATVVNESEDSQRAARSSRHQLTTRYLSMESESCTETTATQILDLPTDLHFRQGEIQVDAAVKVVFKQMFVQDGDRKKRFAIQLSVCRRLIFCVYLFSAGRKIQMTDDYIFGHLPCS